MTHLLESERMQIVRRPERLLTPKVQYFFFSLCLVLLLPLNGVTPLFEGGIVDLAGVIAVATALSAAFATMFVLARGTSRNRWAQQKVRSKVALALFSCGSM
jgi:hypothetical protein